MFVDMRHHCGIQLALEHPYKRTKVSVEAMVKYHGHETVMQDEFGASLCGALLDFNHIVTA